MQRYSTLLHLFVVATTLSAVSAGLGHAQDNTGSRSRFQRFNAPKKNSDDADSQEFLTTEGQQTGDEAIDRIKLNYNRAPWSRVLKDLAEKTNSVLVVHDAPHGEFSRRDWTEYTKAEALRILNQDLQAKGFRILEKGKYLTVISAEQTRPKYERRVIRNRNSLQEPAVTQPHVQDFRRQSAQQPMVNQQSPIQQMGLTTETTQHDANWHQLPQPSTFSPEPLNSNPLTTPEYAPAGQVIKSFRPRAVSAKVLAKRIYDQTRKRSHIVDVGPNNLPAFAIKGLSTSPELQPPVLVSIGIDQAREQLVIEGSQETVRQFMQLATQFDQFTLGDAEGFRIVDADQSRQSVANRVKQLIRVSKQWSFAQPAPNGGIQQIAFQDEPEPALPSRNGTENGQMQPGTVIPGADGQLPSIIGGLKGDVQVEALPDLDLLILRGNEEDVEAVMKVIRTIEQMAIGSTPEIHLLMLQHVNSESLAELLNDVYEQLGEARVGTASPVRSVQILPVVKPNAILIIAPDTILKSVLDLANELDKPVDPSSEVEVFYLESAVSTDVAETLEEFYEERGGLGTRIYITADARTNSVIVQARPIDLQEVARIVSRIDRDHSKAVGQLKVFELRHAIAEELAEFMTDVFSGTLDSQTGTGAGQGGGQNNQQLRSAKSMVLEFLAQDANAQKLVRSGVLSDIRITANARANTIAVTAPAKSMQLIEALISVLDQPSNTVADVKVFELENADAANAVELLQDIFGEENDDQTGVRLAGTQDSGSSLVPLRFSIDARTNSVVAIGGVDALRIVEAILIRLDQTESKNRRTIVLKLRNSPAVDVANAINEFLDGQRQLAEIDPERISTSELLNQEVIVTPEPVTNNIIISASESYFEEILSMAQQLDQQPDQVIIQALLVEVALDNTEEFGIELGLQSPVLFDRSVLENIEFITTTVVDGITQTTTETQEVLSAQATPGFQFNNNPLGTNPQRVGIVGGQGVSNFALGRTNNDLGYGGLVLSASSDAVNVLIRALSFYRNVRILSRPQVLALDNQTAQIQVGQQVPIVNGVNISGVGVANPNIIQDEAGLILTVTPRISPEGQVVMEAIAEKSAFQPGGVPIFTDATTGNVILSPIKDITTARTTVSVADGQTVVLGGIITQSDTTINRKVPWLGDIPIIGRAFRFDTESSERTELLIFLTPRIVHTDEDVEFVKQVEAGRLNWIAKEAEAIHGPIFGVPEEHGPQILNEEEYYKTEVRILDENELPTNVDQQPAYDQPAMNGGQTPPPVMTP